MHRKYEPHFKKIKDELLQAERINVPIHDWRDFLCETRDYLEMFIEAANSDIKQEDQDNE